MKMKSKYWIAGLLVATFVAHQAGHGWETVVVAVYVNLWMGFVEMRLDHLEDKAGVTPIFGLTKTKEERKVR